MSAGEQSLILKTSDFFNTCFTEMGKRKHLPEGGILFHEDVDNDGVFLVVGGAVCMSVKGITRLERLCGSGSVLGLPSSFTGRPYTLTATAITEADVVHVAREDFFRLMFERPDLCREATEILGREMSFIQSALAERRRQTPPPRISGVDLAVVYRSQSRKTPTTF
jgi:CRP-like cAMP-binding protein